ncbi:MAG: dephospho-CoA kinase [Acidobacteria bacterium]|nr:dephospho-CoA kinase [Acidobacteriota bacterium]MBV9184417.1 dephospho-CoA kinase [Acidobacteriota bacterium]
MILRTGLTGGIASGKSTIARMFADLGCITVDADQIVARLYQPGQAGHDAIVRTYGSGILLPDGTIDRRKLADVALATDESAKALNALIHPLVVAEEVRMMDEETRGDGDRIVMVEATLLIEAGGKDRYDRIIVVDVDPETQLARAIARGMTREDAERRIARQMPREERLRYADYVIDNSGDLRAAEAETRRVFGLLLRDLRL